MYVCMYVYIYVCKERDSRDVTLEYSLRKYDLLTLRQRYSKYDDL